MCIPKGGSAKLHFPLLNSPLVYSAPEKDTDKFKHSPKGGALLKGRFQMKGIHNKQNP